MKYQIEPDIRRAETLPAAFYRSAEIFERMKEQIFLRSWQWVGDANTLLPMTEMAYPLTLLEKFLDEPLVLVRDAKDHLHCLSNVCTHRGNLLLHTPGKVKQLLCLYHGRRFQTNGRFKAMPEFREAEDFPRACDDLPDFYIENWNNQLFISLAPMFSFDKIGAVMQSRIGFLPLHQFKFDKALSKDYLVNCHWALYCDNYLEGFHIPFVHHDLNAVLDFSAYATEVYDFVNLQVGYARGAEEVFVLPQNHPDYGRKVAAYYFWVFPNMMFNYYPWGLSVNLISPITMERTKVSFLTYVYDESKLTQGAGALLDKVEREDEFVVEGVHKGLKSRYYNSGRFSPTREQGVHHFHSLLAKYC
jgi:choline monooxygenase